MGIERHSDRGSDLLAQRTLETRRTDARLQGQAREKPGAEAVDRFRATLQKHAGSQSQASRQAPGQEAAPQARTGEQARLAQEARQEAARGDRGGLEQSAAGSVRDRVERKEDASRQSSSRQDGSLDVASMWQAQMALRNDAPAMPPTPTPVNTQAFAELIRRHVLQMAASDSALRDGDGQVLLRMSDATLPGTDLLLSRTADGWRLQADSRSRSSYDAIRQAAPELARRFADSNLGHLEIDPHLHA